jgi:hypothetical protein
MPSRQPKREFEVLVTFTDKWGRVHEPPDPPLVKGYPPWFPRPNEYRRNAPLKRCPETKCRRAQTCVSLLYGEFCQKTHMEAEEYRGQLAAKIDRLYKERFGPDYETPIDPANPCPTPPREMKLALEKAEAQKLHQELLNWQRQWVAGMQAKEAADGKPR